MTTKLTVTTAKMLSDSKKAELEKEFSAKYGDFTVDYVVESAIIGGMIIFDGNEIFDGSISARLNLMKERAKGRVK